MVRKRLFVVWLGSLRLPSHTTKGPEPTEAARKTILDSEMYTINGRDIRIFADFSIWYLVIILVYGIIKLIS